MKIYQITDPHIPTEGGANICANFLKLMEYCRAHPPDLLVISGDLPREDGDIEAYRWIKEQLPAAIDYIVIPGNHDDPQTLYEVFNDSLNSSPEFLLTIPLKRVDVVFVNSGSGTLPDDHLIYIGRDSIRENSVLFIHHPTKNLSGGYMDRTYALGNREQVDKAIAGSKISQVFCGHFHTEYKVESDYTLYVTPSPAFEVDLYSEKPVMRPPRIPLRIIAIEDDYLHTEVIYLDEEAGDGLHLP